MAHNCPVYIMLGNVIAYSNLRLYVTGHVVERDCEYTQFANLNGYVFY